MKSVSAQLARVAVGFWDIELSELPKEVVLEAKRCLLDSIGIAIGGYGAPACTVVSEWAKETGGKKEASLIGSGFMLPAPQAALVNGTLLRYLDYMDSYGGDGKGGWHGAEIIPAVLAVGELVHASGEDILKAIVLGYELGARLLDVAGNNIGSSIGSRGLHHATVGYIIVPAIIGPLLEMRQDQIANAIGSSGSMVTLGILDAMPHEPNPMAKNVAFPLGCHIGIIQALWAKNGFTGPANLFEGHRGLVQAVFGEEYDLVTLRKTLLLPWKRYAILENMRKIFPVETSALGSIEAVHRLVSEHEIKSIEIEQINIVASERCVFHNGDPHRFYSLNKETADHSLPYAVSMVVLEGDIGPDQFTAQKLKDPRVPEIVKKINLRGDPVKKDSLGMVEVEIKTKDRGSFSTNIKCRKGHSENPMSDDEVRGKFLKMARGHLGGSRARECIDRVYNFEDQTDIVDFMKSLVF